MPNSFVHVELHTTDIDKAKKFYSQLFAWQLDEVPMPGGTYTVIKPGKGTGGGMMQQRVPGAPSSWLAYESSVGLPMPAIQTRESPSLARGAFSGGETWAKRPWVPTLVECDYFGCCGWSVVVAGAEELLESCSRSFFSRLISTRPPMMCFVFASSLATGALPMPTR